MCIRDRVYSHRVAAKNLTALLEKEGDYDLIYCEIPPNEMCIRDSDYYVEIPGISGGQKDKLTHAGIYGVDASMRTLSPVSYTHLDVYKRQL